MVRVMVWAMVRVTVRVKVKVNPNPVRKLLFKNKFLKIRTLFLKHPVGHKGGNFIKLKRFRVYTTAEPDTDSFND